jgi:signal transduction histidine kinase
MKVSLRERLIAVSVLAVAACVAALVSILVLSRTGEQQRIERARDFVTQEIERLQERASERPNFFMRRGFRRPLSGYLTPSGDDVVAPNIEHPPALTALRSEAFLEASQTSSVVVKSRVSRPLRTRRARLDPQAEGMIVLAVGPVRGVGFAWSATWVVVPPGERTSRVGIFALCVLTLLLIAATFFTLSSVRTGVAQLRASLEALAHNLSAPIERPAATELAAVSDGIASLAQALQRSVTEQTRLTHALEQRERLASLGRVVAGVAHEVRNPMAAIKLRVDMARNTVLSPRPDLPGVSADLAEIGDEVSRLDRLVADLLVVSGRKLAHTQEISLRTLVEQRMQTQQPIAQPKNIKLVVHGEARADVDVDRVVRAVDNLLRNAIEASPENHEVQVRLAMVETHAIVEIIDHGTGITKEQESQLFEPFFTTKPEGTGLGLALSRAVAEAHGGMIVYRRENNTTVFSMTLSLRQMAESIS